MSDLGELKRVDPREMWPSEARDFTPWLAENLDFLGEALGRELELIETESAVGDFSIDILANELGRNEQVVIENQLEPTDHTHLGQLITYAAGVDAGTVVWIAREFREEHRQAIDWLNQAHGSETEFFGVALELLTIDVSRPAANLRVLAAPNDWARAPRRGRRRGDLTEKQLAYRDFFQALIDELRDSHRFTNARAGQPQNWYSFASGIPGFQYSVSFAHGSRLRAEIYIDIGNAERNHAAFQALQGAKSELEAAFGEPLEWEELPDRRACRIACYREGVITDAAGALAEHRAWAIDRLLCFKREFGPKLREAASA